MKETFRTRFGLIVALIGMAVGTGNIWRFPRVMAANGGGAFLIPWFLFLFLWSIPLLIVEFSIGQKIRKGVAACFCELTNGKLTWLGSFVVICTLGIMCYYSVVTGWCLYYLTKAISGAIFTVEPQALWTQFTSSGVEPLCFHGFVIILAVFVLLQGVRSGIETMSVVMIPALVIILIALCIYSLFLPGRSEALSYLFNPDFSKLSHYKIWLEGLTQSAWSTGAGWGIALTYAGYARADDRPVLTPFTTGFGNNSIELLAGIAVLVPLFSFFSLPEVIDLTGKGNSGLTFVALPGLFKSMPGGHFVAVLFFLGLFFAAFTSLVSMIELGVRFAIDFGMNRIAATFLLGLICLLLGAPSAIDMKIFDNQDWVWGVGLLVSGFFFSILMRSLGMKEFFKQFVPIKSKFYQFFFKGVILWLIPLQFFVLVGWWFFQSTRWDPAHWWDPFSSLSIGTCLFQWGGLLVILFGLNSTLSKRMKKSG